MTDKSLRLYTGTWNDQYTFKALPVTKECPFLEVIWDPETKKCAVIGTFIKDSFTLLQKMDKDGTPVFTQDFKKSIAKFGSTDRALQAASEFGVNPYARERVVIQNVNEYVLTDLLEIEDFIERFCENAGSYNYKSFLNAPPAQPKNIEPVIETVETPQTAGLAAVKE